MSESPRSCILHCDRTEEPTQTRPEGQQRKLPILGRTLPRLALTLCYGIDGLHCGRCQDVSAVVGTRGGYLVSAIRSSCARGPERPASMRTDSAHPLNPRSHTQIEAVSSNMATSQIADLWRRTTRRSGVRNSAGMIVIPLSGRETTVEQRSVKEQGHPSGKLSCTRLFCCPRNQQYNAFGVRNLNLMV